MCLWRDGSVWTWLAVVDVVLGFNTLLTTTITPSLTVVADGAMVQSGNQMLLNSNRLLLRYRCWEGVGSELASLLSYTSGVTQLVSLVLSPCRSWKCHNLIKLNC